MNPDDITLKRAAKQDHEAFESIVLLYQGRLYGLCLRMLGNEQDALDAAQETFIKIYQNLPGYRNIASFSTWAYRIATNTCLDMLRKRKTRLSLSVEEMEEEGGSAHLKASDDVEGEVMRGITSSELMSAIDALPEDQRMAIVLRDVHGLTYDEIANMLKLNLNTVKSRISRGRRSLRKSLSSRPELFSI
jgi:RNA polymerase sigma-70 factor (ECF subfamily)